MTVAELDELIAKGETERVEMTRAFDKADKIGQAICAFANDYRNPLLAEAMKVLGFVNKYNRGISKVNKELEGNGNPHAQFDVNKLTEFRVTVVASKSGTINGQINQKSGQIKSRSGQIKGKDGTIKTECGTINGQINQKSGQIKSRSGQINGQINDADSIVFKIVCKESGIKVGAIALEIVTPERTVRRSLKRLVSAKKIEYRGSKKTGGWYVRT